MMTKTGSWLVASTLAVAALWAAPAKADDAAVLYCTEQYDVCMERASWEREDWIRDYMEQECQSFFYMCMGTYNCGDNVCDNNWGETYYCPADCD